MDNIKKDLTALCKADFVGSVQSAADVVKTLITPICDEVYTDKTGGVVGVIHGKNEYKIMLEAHIDEIGLVVTEILGDGFVRVAPVGGVDVRVLPSSRVIIHGKSDVFGVFTSTPPHLAKDENNKKKFPDFGEIMVDTGRADVGEFVRCGDFATFSASPESMVGTRFTAKAIDDRGGCAALIYAARKLKAAGMPDNTIVFAFASGEELGCRGSQTLSFEIMPDEAVAVDVSFAQAPANPPEHCGEMGKGPMIGISPRLCRDVSDKLTDIADEYNIPYQFEIMGSRTGTDADVITVTKGGIKCGLVSIPLKNMHTPVEVVDLDDIMQVGELLYRYAASGEKA